MFTINITNGEIYGVEHFLGSDYQNIILTTIKKQLTENIEIDPKLIYFDEEINNLKITNNQPYYIDRDKHVVIIFNQFEIASVYMSLSEFIINYFIVILLLTIYFIYNKDKLKCFIKEED